MSSNEAKELAKFLSENSGLGIGDEEEEEPRGLVSQIVKEFRCLPCGRPFSRQDCKIDAKGVFVSVKRCPFCKSDRIIRQTEQRWATERKYEVDVEEAILGPKPGKYASLAVKKAILSGKIQRKKS